MVRAGLERDHEETQMLAQEAAPLMEQGSVQFILFGVMVLVIFIVMWITIAK